MELSKVESMSGGAALGAGLMTWLKDTEETVEVARKVVGTVWPQLPRAVTEASSSDNILQDQGGAH
jgi:hypothetical protein